MIAISLGSNLGDRQQNLTLAKCALRKIGFNITKESSIYESPADLKSNTAKDEWQKNFLNQVLLGNTKLGAEELLQCLQKIERDLGRSEKANWAPRIIDLDILFYKDLKVVTPTLTIPHLGLLSRYYVLSPLREILRTHDPYYKEVLAAFKDAKIKSCLWVGILNLSPDSFAENNSPIEDRIIKALEDEPHIIDIGAESTRPSACPLKAKEEWQRLKPYLSEIIKQAHAKNIKVSLDTYHAETAEKAIESGIDMINDVSGLSTDMQKVATICDIDWVFMHNLGIPANKQKILPKEKESYLYLQDWLEEKKQWIFKQKDPYRFIFDPGLGFGKDACQSRHILRDIEKIDTSDLKLYIGHSRKSFLNGITHKEFAERDLETISISLDLMKRGVNYLRVHNVKAHKQAMLALQGIY